jgi:8-oxo-dGTP pyrophosphatase MutT (NUDIX family)
MTTSGPDTTAPASTSEFTAAVARLTDQLREPLPGLETQREMAPVGRILEEYDADPAGAKQSAVLLLVTPDLHLVFIRRAEDGRPHGGQIAFPGGLRESVDTDLTQTALRETEEEIGLPRGTITVLGSLSRLYIPVSNYSVQPVVGAIASRPSFTCQPDEVDEALLLPISDFVSVRDDFEYVRGTTTYTAPCYRFGRTIVWGATAMMTAEFLWVWEKATGRGSD